MVRGRFLLAGVLALVVLGLIFGAVSNGQRDAWTQGYLVGRLTAVEGADALAPALLPQVYGYPQQGPGFGGFLLLLLGIGAVAFVASRFARMAQWRAWAMQQGMMPEGSHSDAAWGGAPMGWGGPGMGCGRRQRQPDAPPQATAAPPVQEQGEAR